MLPGRLLAIATCASLVAHAAMLILAERLGTRARLSEHGSTPGGVLEAESRLVFAELPPAGSQAQPRPLPQPILSPELAVEPVPDLAMAEDQASEIKVSALLGQTEQLTTEVWANPVIATEPMRLTSTSERHEGTSQADRAPEAPVEAEPRAAPVSFAGVATERAARIVYAVDAGGGMASSLAYVKQELVRSILGLQEDQQFQVIVVRQLPGESTPTQRIFAPGRDAVAATTRVKEEATAWIATIEPGGRSSPLAALEGALRLRADLVYFMTRSIRRSGPESAWAGGIDVILQRLEGLNPRGAGGVRPAVIKCLQFIDHDPTGTLPAIANTHGDGPGSYQVIVPR